MSSWVPPYQNEKHYIYIYLKRAYYSRTQDFRFSGIKFCNDWLIFLSKVLKIYSRTQEKRIRCNKLKYNYFPWFCGYFPGHPRPLPYKKYILLRNHEGQCLSSPSSPMRLMATLIFSVSSCFLFEMMRYHTENRIYKHLIFKGESRIEPF